MPVVDDGVAADRAGGDDANRGAADRDDPGAGDVTPHVLGSPTGSEYGDIVAVDGEIVEWLARRERRRDR